MITLENLSIGYTSKNNRKVVAEGINATLNDSELTCLIGPNGIGKSTLLRTLSAFQPPLEGSITIDGKRLETLSDKEVSRLIGVVLTTKPDVQNITVTELVGLGRSPYTGFWGTLNEKDSEIVEESIAKTGITHLAERMIQTLSDGERQKVMIAKALAQQTPVIYLDEPTAFLDYPSSSPPTTSSWLCNWPTVCGCSPPPQALRWEHPRNSPPQALSQGLSRDGASISTPKHLQ